MTRTKTPQTTETLYHSRIGLPDWFVAPTERVPLKWTYHAEIQRQEDRYGIIRRFKTATLGRLEVIEIGVRDNKVSKILFRGTFNERYDVCMVLIPGKNEWTVKTVWLNDKTDTHDTLNPARYATA